jgi:dTDP-4-amino-4,6-dideoxygalactose transaminase
LRHVILVLIGFEFLKEVGRNMGKIPFIDLRAGVVKIRKEIDSTIARIIDNTAFVLGPELEGFEEDFAAYCGVKHCTGTSSGTSALHLSLLGYGIGPGDEVITVPNTFIATVEAIAMTGAKPVLVDVREDTSLIDPELAAAAVTTKTRAIIPVHLFGQCCDMDPLMELARDRGLIVIEDACQAHGASYKGRRAGSLGHAAAFSFYPSKNLGAFGEGGAITTSDEGFMKRVKGLRHHAQYEKNIHAEVGYNYRLEALQAAILRVKLGYLDESNDLRRAAAGRYIENLDGTAYRLPVEREERRHVYHLFTLGCPDKIAVEKALTEAGIGWGEHYPIPVHLQPAFASLGYGEGAFPIAEKHMGEIVSLPMYPELSIEDVDRVCYILKSVT